MKTTTTDNTNNDEEEEGECCQRKSGVSVFVVDLIALLEKVRAQPVGGEVRFAMQPAKARRGCASLRWNRRVH